eukprot:2011814-Pleurochrysis_carterae.AAC.1
MMHGGRALWPFGMGARVSRSEGEKGKSIEPSWRRRPGPIKECADCARIFWSGHGRRTRCVVPSCRLPAGGEGRRARSFWPGCAGLRIRKRRGPAD